RTGRINQLHGLSLAREVTTPADHPVNKMQRRRNKVKDKPPPEPHREYLDAESSDEAERHEKSDVSFQIQCVKDMTTLSGLTDSDWTRRCDIFISEFFHDPSIPVLSIYRVNGSLTIEFSFPTVPVHELTYFVRQPNEILYPEDFRERILFGSMNDKVESHILGVMQNVLAPIFFTIETWPDRALYLFRFNPSNDHVVATVEMIIFRLVNAHLVNSPPVTRRVPIALATTKLIIVHRRAHVAAIDSSSDKGTTMYQDHHNAKGDHRDRPQLRSGLRS
ncbi:hypothetical protein DMN91_002317, partial [Ooceraea biroi]